MISCRADEVDTTLGFTDLPFNTSYYHLHKPYDLPETQRYSFAGGVHRLWVYATDKPYRRGSPTKPRTELMISGYTYSSGIWQFEGQGYVPKGTNGVCIMQVFGATRRATSLMLRVYNGSLMYYQRAVIVPEIFDRWFRLNVIHDVEAAALEVYVDGVLLLVVADHGGKSHYFKFGVYGQNNMSDCMESRWKGIRVLYKNVT
ncbi:unnamed protein product [Linum tenue]|nr:unnamed protein product [Linum tenue]